MRIESISSGAPNQASAPAQAAPTTPPAPAAAAPQPAAVPSDAQLKAAVKAANEAVSQLPSSIEFSIDTESGKTVVKVVDMTTQQLIRQIPSPEMLEMSHALDRLQGLLFKQKA